VIYEYNQAMVIFFIVEKARWSGFREASASLSIAITAYPMSLCPYSHRAYCQNDSRKEPNFRRRVLQLLLRHVFTPTHNAIVEI
jgi:hypothetical protein